MSNQTIIEWRAPSHYDKEDQELWIAGHGLRGNKFGCELECEFSGEVPFDENVIPRGSGWIGKRDGSLRNGREYVFSTPQTYLTTRSLIRGLYKNLPKNFTPSVRTSFHVHNNVNDLTINQVIAYATTYICFEQVLLNFCGENRVGNCFCFPVVNQGFTSLGIKKTLTPGGCFSASQSKYGALNWAALSEFGTLEFRGMRAPLNVEVLLDWLKMINRIRKFALSLEDPSEILMMVSQTSWEEVGQQIFTDLWPQLEKLKGPDHDPWLGIETAQDLVYGG